MFSGADTLPDAMTLVLLTIVAFVAAAVAMMLVGRISLVRMRGPQIGTRNPLSDGCVLLFRKRTLWHASDRAVDMLGAAGMTERAAREGGDAVLNWLIGRFGPAHPGFEQLITDLLVLGKAFCVDIKFSDEVFFQVEGVPRGPFAAIYVRDLSEERKATLRLRHEIRESRRELGRLREVIDAAPIAAWVRPASSADLSWSNARARRLFGGRALPAPLFDQAVNAQDAQPLRVHLSAMLQSHGPDWVELREVAIKEDMRLGYCSDISGLVETEAALHRFIATLTETFSHLSIGLAIFDEDRRLGLFNPSFAEMLKLDPAWLASRPTLRGLLDALRTASVTPPHKDREAWQAMVADLEAQAMAGVLEDQWMLPSGQTLRISGRPHPNNAMALMFEDVSGNATLEQRYRSEIAVNRATMEQVDAGIAIFSMAGELSYANGAFARIWGLDLLPGQRLSIADLTAHIIKETAPALLWDDLRSFVTGQAERTIWSRAVQMRDGRTGVGTFAPMPDGSSLLLFDERARNRPAENPARVGQEELLPVAHDPQFDLPTARLVRVQSAVTVLAQDIGNRNTAIDMSLLQIGEEFSLSVRVSVDDSPISALTLEERTAMRLLRRHLEALEGTVSADPINGGSKLLIHCVFPRNPKGKTERNISQKAI